MAEIFQLVCAGLSNSFPSSPTEEEMRPSEKQEAKLGTPAAFESHSGKFFIHTLVRVVSFAHWVSVP